MRPEAILLVFVLASQNGFCVYYGNVGPDEVSKLNSFDLVILSPLVDREYLAQIHAVKLGYISLTTASSWEPWIDPKTVEEITIGRYGLWNESYVDVTDERWVRTILDEAVPYLLEKGFDGVFLDNLDAVDWYVWNLPQREEELKEGVIDLIKEIRGRYPDIEIVVNRGFSIIDKVAPYIDGVLFESFGTYYDFSKNKYMKFSGDDLEWIRAQYSRLESLARKNGWKYLLLLGYADPDNSTMVSEFYRFMKGLNGERPIYISDKYLSVIVESSPVEGTESSNLQAWPLYLGVPLAIGLLALFWKVRSSTGRRGRVERG